MRNFDKVLKEKTVEDKLGDFFRRNVQGIPKSSSAFLLLRYVEKSLLKN